MSSKLIGKNSTHESCPICLEDYQKEEKTTETKCQHLFHEACFKQYVNKSNPYRPINCPICKQELPDIARQTATKTRKIASMVLGILISAAAAVFLIVLFKPLILALIMSAVFALSVLLLSYLFGFGHICGRNVV